MTAHTEPAETCEACPPGDTHSRQSMRGPDAPMELVKQARIAIIAALDLMTDADTHPRDRNRLFTAYDILGEVNPANE